MGWRTASTCVLVAWLGVSAFVSTGHASATRSPILRWQVALPGWGEPAADASVAYFLTRDHEVVAVDIATGSVKWRSRTAVGGADVPTGTVVRLTTSQVIVGDAGIVALDRASGREIFRYTAPDGDDPGVFLGSVDDDLIVAGSPMGRLYALDAATGALAWLREVVPGERRAVFAPATIGKLVLVTFTTFDGPLTGGLVAFDRTGHRRWTRRFAAGIGAAGPPVLVGEHVAVARTDGYVEVVGAMSGRQVWTVSPEPSRRDGASARDIRALASIEQQLVVTSLHGPIRAFDMRTRRQQWEFSGGPLDAAALRVRVYGGHVYIPYSDGSLVALDRKTGAQSWRLDPEASSYDWPPAAGVASIFAGGSHALFAFDSDVLETAAGGRP